MPVHTVRRIVARVRGLFHSSAERARADDELRAELEHHVELHAAENIRRGMTPDVAWREARAAAAGITQAVEGVREQRTIPWIEVLAAECRQALRARVISQHPAFAVSVVLSLAIGISCAAGVFAVVESARFGPMPFANASRVEHIYRASRARQQDRWWTVPPAVMTVLATADPRIEAIAAYQLASMQVRHDDRTSRTFGVHVTTNFTSLLGARAALGRLFDSTDANAPAVVLSYDYWRSEFASDSAIVGRVLQVDGVPRTIIGVASRESMFPERASLWQSGLQPRATEVGVLALLRPGATPEELRPIIATLGSGALRDVNRKFANGQVASTELRSYMLTGGMAGVVLGLTILAVFVGLLAAVNFAALMLARGIRRRGEIGVRAALGASVPQLARHIIGECVVLCALGGALGALFAPAVIAALGTGLSQVLPPWLVIDAGWRTIAASVVLATIIGVVFGLGPALDIARPALGVFLQSASGTTSDGGRLARTRSRLVAIQVALATGVLIALGSLVGRALLPIDVDPGFDYLPIVRGFVRDGETAPKGMTTEQRFERVLYESRQTPGVGHAGFRELFFAFPAALISEENGRETTAEDAGFAVAYIDRIGDGYLSVLRPRVVAGRLPSDDELRRNERVAVITKSLAARLYDGSAVNKVLRMDVGGTRRFTIIGVVDDVREHPYDSRSTAIAMIPIETKPLLGAGLVGGRELWIRSVTPTPVALRALRLHLTSSRLPGLEVANLEALSTIMRRELQSFREVARVFGAIFAVALLLAAFGIYGLGAFTAEMRSREFAIREALGATRTDIARRVLSSAIVQAAIGLAAGAVVSTMILEYLTAYQLKLTTAFGATVVAVVVVSLTVLMASIGPVASAWRRNLAAELKASA
jgi:predicted permease